MQDKIEKTIKDNYDFVVNNLKIPERIIDYYFGIDNINADISEINEELIRSTFFGFQALESYEIFRYDDFYDFINTYLKIDSNDLIIYVGDKEFNVFVIQFIKVLNMAFKNWILSKSSGFRKNSKILLRFIEGKGSIILEYIPDLKL